MLKLVILFLIGGMCIKICCGETSVQTELQSNTSETSFLWRPTARLLETGRTLVHHAVKRFMILLPVLFFKMGIAFSLLVLVTLVAVNNGFIGFMLLVVGLSSVLARMQEAHAKSTSIAYLPQPHPISYAHGHLPTTWDRSDRTATAPGPADDHKRFAEMGPYTDAFYNNRYKL